MTVGILLSNNDEREYARNGHCALPLITDTDHRLLGACGLSVCQIMPKQMAARWLSVVEVSVVEAHIQSPNVKKS